MINLYDESIRDVVREKIPQIYYIATLRNNIYHTHQSSDAVTCYTIQGEIYIQWTFKNGSVLKCPHGIDVDNDGNVYAAGTIRTML